MDKRIIRGLLPNDFFSQNSNLPGFLTFTRPVGMRRVHISCEWYLYSFRELFVLYTKQISYYSSIETT